MVANLNHHKGHADLLDGLGAVRTRLPDDFVLLFHDRDRDEWGIELNERLDPTVVVQLLETFKQAMLQMLAQHLSSVSDVTGCGASLTPPSSSRKPNTTN
jgi:hypothetical protein